jgi:ligand-binding sensor domain-containing protein
MGRGNRAGALWVILCGILALSAPASAGMTLFAAGSGQISSVGVLDITEDIHGSLYFGTDNGLSTYDGAWRITHMTYGDTGKGLISDHVLSLEFDQDGSLWIGYPNGLQRLEGDSFVTVRDQQMLKSLDIHELMRRGREMWVAAGNAGIHRYLDGSWRWFQPGGREGLGCNYVTSMATDPARNILYVACSEGIWSTGGTANVVTFSPLAKTGLIPEPVRGIRGDPFGGIYIFNSSSVVLYTPENQARVIVHPGEPIPGIDIADIAVDADGTLWVATNNGIYAWNDGVREHVDAARGIGNNGVKKIYIDAGNRLWFVTPDNVGFFQLTRASDAGNPVIPITTFSIPTMAPAPPTPPSQITPGISIQGSPDRTPVPPDPLTGFLDALRSFFMGFFPG